MNNQNGKKVYFPHPLSFLHFSPPRKKTQLGKTTQVSNISAKQNNAQSNVNGIFPVLVSGYFVLYFVLCGTNEPCQIK